MPDDTYGRASATAAVAEGGPQRRATVTQHQGTVTHQHVLNREHCESAEQLR